MIIRLICRMSLLLGNSKNIIIHVSVESQQNAKKEIFGREMAEKFENGQSLPNL